MHISWGLKIAVLYCSFAVGMIFLVVASSRQKFDLVTTDYYKQEIGYQKVIDASRNQAALSAAVSIHANETSVIFDLPAEMQGRAASATINFYSPVSKEWDKVFKVTTDNRNITISRSELRNTRYTIKLSFSADGKDYYQESEIQLGKP